MAVSTQNDLQSYDAEFNTLMQVELARNSIEIAAASNGAIQISPESLRGDFKRTQMFDIDIANVKDRDDNDLSAVPADPIQDFEEVGVKKKKYFKMGTTDDAFFTNGQSRDNAIGLMAQEWGKTKPAVMLDDALTGAVAAMLGNAPISTPATGPITHRSINTALSTFGDQYKRISAFVMSSASWFGLTSEVLTNIKFQTTDLLIAEGTVGTFGKPVVVVDSAALGAPGGAEHYVLGLTPGSIMLKESAPENILIDRKQDGQNITTEFGVNTEYVIGVKGYGWNSAERNPNTATLGASANWQQVTSQARNTAGVILAHTGV